MYSLSKVTGGEVMPLCKYCHAQLAGNEKFCPECGKKVEVEENNDNSAFLWGFVSALVPVVGFVLYFKNVATRPSSAKGALAGAIIHVVLVFLAIILLFYYLVQFVESLEGFY